MTQAKLENREQLTLAVVIPCYQVRGQIAEVLARIGDEVERIYVVDDACPEGTGDFVESDCQDPRVCVVRRPQNGGVGAATVSGYRQALEHGADVIIKIDGDGQMDPALIPRFVHPIASGDADYTKGNRFFNVEDLAQMPKVRLLGSAILSFISKASTGYWNIFDPTNGYTAIHGRVAELLPLDKLSNRYFFESDILFRLNTLRAIVVEIPMTALYGNENSSLRVHRVAGEFLFKNMWNFLKRLLYNYLLRGFSLASVQFLVGVALGVFGCVFGVYHWWSSWASGVPATSGTVMVAGLSVILGVQFVLAFLAHDMQDHRGVALHRRL